MQPLSISAATLTTCLGAGLAPHRAALFGGRSGLEPCRFETVTLATHVGEIHSLDAPLTGELEGFDCRNNRLALQALAQDDFVDTVAHARSRYGAHRVAVILGTSTGGILNTEQAYRERDPETGLFRTPFNYAGTHNVFSIARLIAQALALEGPTQSLSAACATTAKAFASAARMIAAGLCDAAVVGGADTLCLTTLYGFHALELTAEGPCRPFDMDRCGISIGEAAGFALLERATDADSIRLLGVGESCDAYHMSSPHPEGVGALLAMERALSAAGLAAPDIDYINLHGTATLVGDSSEDRAVVGLFGADVPCSSTKGMTGHTLGAAGIVEAILSMLSLEAGFMPGSPTTQRRDPALVCNYLLQGGKKKLARVMSNSFGFGGSNCALILGQGPW